MGKIAPKTLAAAASKRAGNVLGRSIHAGINKVVGKILSHWHRCIYAKCRKQVFVTYEKVARSNGVTGRGAPRSQPRLRHFCTDPTAKNQRLADCVSEIAHVSALPSARQCLHISSLYQAGMQDHTPPALERSVLTVHTKETRLHTKKTYFPSQSKAAKTQTN